MKKMECAKFSEMFDYLYNPSLDLKKADGAIIFGRADTLVAKKAGEVYAKNQSDYFIFTGGIGKDSGYLTNLEIPEAKWQAALANSFYNIPSQKIYLEPNSTNGGENCRFSIDKIVEQGLPHKDIILLSHPTSLRRLNAVMGVISKEKLFESNYQRLGTDYNFDPKNPIDQKEAVLELLRLADWPSNNWCVPQKDLPLDLVEYAREIKDFI